MGDSFLFEQGPFGRGIKVDASGRLIATGETTGEQFIYTTGSTGRALLVDASGRLILSPDSPGLGGTGTIDGTGSADKISRFADADTLENSSLSDDGFSISPSGDQSINLGTESITFKILHAQSGVFASGIKVGTGTTDVQPNFIETGKVQASSGTFASGVVSFGSARAADPVSPAEGDLWYKSGFIFRDGSTSRTITKHAGQGFRSAVQTLATSDWRKILIDSKNAEIGMTVDISTNNRITVARNGSYLIIGKVTLDPNEDGKRVLVRVLKDGVTTLARADDTSGGTNLVTVTAISVASLFANDFLELEVFHDKGADLDTLSTNPPELIVIEL